MEVMRPFDFLLCRRDALAAPCQEAVLKTARFSTRGYFNIPNFAPVHFFCLRSFFIEIVSLLPEHLYALRIVIAVSTGRNAILRMIGVSGRQDNSEDDDPSYQVLRMSRMFDAPPGTQTQGESSQVSICN